MTGRFWNRSEVDRMREIINRNEQGTIIASCLAHSPGRHTMIRHLLLESIRGMEGVRLNLEAALRISEEDQT